MYPNSLEFGTCPLNFVSNSLSCPRNFSSLADLFPDRLQLVFEDRGEGKKPLQSRATVILTMGAGGDSTRRGANSDRAACRMGRARPLSRRASVADAHIGADVLGAELHTPFFRGRFKTVPVILFGGDISFAVSAIKAAIGLDLGHVSCLPGNYIGRILLREEKPGQGPSLLILINF